MTKKLNIFAILLVMFTLSSCTLYEDVEMLGVQSYDMSAPKDGLVKASIVFKINNPNFYSIKIKKSDFEVFLDDDLLGNAEMANDLVIKKKTESDYTLELLLKQQDIKDNAMSMIRKAFLKKTIIFRVKGKAKCKVWGILGKKIDIDERKEISLMDLMNKFK